MKKKALHIAVCIFLLSLLLVGRVGIHLFHHHETTAEWASIKSSGAEKNTSINSENLAEEEVDCALCKIDSFNEIDIEISFFSWPQFFSWFSYPVKCFNNALVFVISTSLRGPPVFNF